MDTSIHKLIARPSGLPGYSPQSYCSVCGKTTTNKPHSTCSSPNCPNSAHNSCLGGLTDFNCGQVGVLRAAQGITSPVLYTEEALQYLPQDSTLTTNTSDTDDDLLELPPAELIDIIQKLRAELSKKNKILRFYNRVSTNISEARDAVENVLDFIDNIAANHASLEEVEVRTIASSARPDRVDHDWVKHVSSSNEAKTWWASSKPQPLFHSSSVLPPGQFDPDTRTQDQLESHQPACTNTNPTQPASASSVSHQVHGTDQESVRLSHNHSPSNPDQQRGSTNTGFPNTRQHPSTRGPGKQGSHPQQAQH